MCSFLCRHQQQDMRMKELFEVASSAPLSPRMHPYIRNDCMPTSRVSMFDFKSHAVVPPPHYMSPRLSMTKGYTHSMDGLHRPDSAHIYYHSPTALPAQPYLKSEPIYEPIPGRIFPIGSFGEELKFETFKPAGSAMPARSERETRRSERTKKNDGGTGVGDTDDYMEMSSIGHLEFTPPGTPPITEAVTEPQHIENGNALETCAEKHHE